ncbi:MAG: oligosaccharide flippase family protein [Planctomycetia bacterium]|nr:oligosaccharide flippase family protein [Planctomycetia bacterium]
MNKLETRTKKAFTLIIARLSNILIALGISATLSRVIIDKEVYGALQQLLMIYSMLSVIFAAGIPQSIFYFLPHYNDGERKGLLLQNIGLLFLQGLMLGLILFTLRNWASEAFHSPSLSNLFRVFALYPVFMLPTLSVEAVLMSYGHVLTFMIFSILSRTLTFLSLVMPIIFGLSIENSILIWDGAALILLIISLMLVFVPVRKAELIWNYGMLKKELKYSLPLAGAAILSSVIVYTDKVIVSKILGAFDYAIYANGAIELPLIGIITGSVQSVLMIDFSLKVKQGLHSEIINIWHRAVFKTALILLPFCGFLFFWAKDFIILLFSQRYTESYEIFRIYIWMVPVKIFTFSSILLPFGASLIFTEIILVNAFIAVAIIPALAYFFGMNGAALGTIIVFWLIFLYGIFRTSPQIKTTFTCFLPWGKISILLIAVIIFGGISKITISNVHIAKYISTPEMISALNLMFGFLIFIILYTIFLEKTKYFQIKTYGKQFFFKTGF